MSLKETIMIVVPASLGTLTAFVGSISSKQQDHTVIETKENGKVKREWIAIGVSFVALLFAGGGFLNSHFQEQRLENLSLLQNSLAYQPQLRYIGAKHRIEYSPQWVRIVGDTTEIAVEMKVYSEVIYRNEGSAMGRLIGILSKDVPSGEDDLRRIIQDQESEKTTLVVKDSDKFFSFREVAIGDSIKITFENKINYVRDSWGTLHFLILYENQAGGFFDTYHWLKYQSKSPVFNKADDSSSLFTPFLSLFTIETTNNSMIIYSQKEKRRVFDLFAKHSLNKE